MNKRVLLLTIFAVPALFGASSSNNNTSGKLTFDELSKQFKVAVQHKNAQGALAIHKQMQSKFKRKNRVEIVNLIDMPAFRGLILHEADNNKNIEQFANCYVPQHPIAQQIRTNNLSKLREQYKQEQKKIKEKCKTNLQELIKAQENQEILKTAKDEFLNQMALYEYAPNKDEIKVQLLSAYDQIQKMSPETAKHSVESLQFRKPFEQLIQEKNKRGLEILRTLYDGNQDLMLLADPILYPAPVASQKMVLFDDVNNNTSGGIAQPQTTTPQTDLDPTVQASLLTKQQNDLTSSNLSDDARQQTALAMPKQQSLSNSFSSDQANLKREQKPFKPKSSSIGTAWNLDKAKLTAKALLQAKLDAEEILHIQNTIKLIMDEVSDGSLTKTDRIELRNHIAQLLNNENNQESTSIKTLSHAKDLIQCKRNDYTSPTFNIASFEHSEVFKEFTEQFTNSNISSAVSTYLKKEFIKNYFDRLTNNEMSLMISALSSLKQSENECINYLQKKTIEEVLVIFKEADYLDAPKLMQISIAWIHQKLNLMQYLKFFLKNYKNLPEQLFRMIYSNHALSTILINAIKKRLPNDITTKIKLTGELATRNLLDNRYQTYTTYSISPKGVLYMFLPAGECVQWDPFNRKKINVILGFFNRYINTHVYNVDHVQEGIIVARIEGNYTKTLNFNSGFHQTNYADFQNINFHSSIKKSNETLKKAQLKIKLRSKEIKIKRTGFESLIKMLSNTQKEFLFKCSESWIKDKACSLSISEYALFESLPDELKQPKLFEVSTIKRF